MRNHADRLSKKHQKTNHC